MITERRLDDIAVRNGMWAAAVELDLQNRIERSSIVENFGLHVIKGVALGAIDIGDLRVEMHTLSHLDREVVEMGVVEFESDLDNREATARRLGHHITLFAYNEVRTKTKRLNWGVRLRGGKLIEEENTYAII